MKGLSSDSTKTIFMCGLYEKHYLGKNVNSGVKQIWVHISPSLLSGCVPLHNNSLDFNFLVLKEIIMFKYSSFSFV